jgi:hypothetical protein
LVEAQWEHPDGWEVYSSRQGAYVGGRVTQAPRNGKGSALLRSEGDASVKEHALLVQKLSAQEYRGRRMELEGYLKSKDVTGWAGLWVRVDDEQGKVLEFHNMMELPVRGTTGWARYSIPFNVDSQAFEIHFGALLAGQGELKADDFAFRVLGGTEPATPLKQKIRSLPLKPRNLGFEK